MTAAELRELLTDVPDDAEIRLTIRGNTPYTVSHEPVHLEMRTTVYHGAYLGTVSPGMNHVVLYGVWP